MQVSRATGLHKPLRRTDSPGFCVGRSPSTCQSGHPVRRRPARYIKRRRVRSMVARKRLAAALVVALAMFVVACGSSDSGSSSSGGGGGGSASTTATGVTKGVAKAPTLDAAQGREGQRDATAPARTRPAARRPSVKAFNSSTAPQGLIGQAARVPDVRRRAAQPVRPAPAGQVGGVRHLLLRRDLDGRVRLAEVAARHDATTSNARKAEFIPSTLQTIHFDGKYCGVPQAHRRRASSTTATTRSRASPTPGRRSTPTPRPRAASSTRARPTRA